MKQHILIKNKEFEILPDLLKSKAKVNSYQVKCKDKDIGFIEENGHVHSGIFRDGYSVIDVDLNK